MSSSFRRMLRVLRERRERKQNQNQLPIECEALEGRQLLSRGLGLHVAHAHHQVAIGTHAHHGHVQSGTTTTTTSSTPSTTTPTSTTTRYTPDSSFHGNGIGLGLGLGFEGDGGFAGEHGFPGGDHSPANLPVSVQTALTAVQKDVDAIKASLPTDSKPSDASVAAFKTDLDAIRAGTLSGTAAQDKLKADRAAILLSAGATQDQVTQLQTDQQVLQDAITAAFPNAVHNPMDLGSSRDNLFGTLGGPGLGGGFDDLGHKSANLPTSVQTAIATVQKDVDAIKASLPTDSKPSDASVAALKTDLDAIRAGTLTGTAAQDKLKADRAAILLSAGVTQDQVTQLQSDQQALQDAIKAAFPNNNSSDFPLPGNHGEGRFGHRGRH